MCLLGYPMYGRGQQEAGTQGDASAIYLFFFRSPGGWSEGTPKRLLMFATHSDRLVGIRVWSMEHGAIEKVFNLEVFLRTLGELLVRNSNTYTYVLCARDGRSRPTPASHLVLRNGKQ